MDGMANLSAVLSSRYQEQQYFSSRDALPQVRGYLHRTRDTVAYYSVGRIFRKTDICRGKNRKEPADSAPSE